MKKTLMIAGTCLLMTGSLAYAAGTHAGAHDDAKTEMHSDDKSDGHHDEMMAVGKAGMEAEVTRTIAVVMKETDDGEMLFEPASLDVKQGETIRFKLSNKGENEHEFVLDEHDSLMEHKEAMAKMPEMEHDDPNSIRLDPGMDGEVIWNFANAGKFEFGCLIPGHYESGMKGDLTVTSN